MEHRTAIAALALFLLVVGATSAAGSCDTAPLLGAPPIVTSTIPYPLSWEGDPEIASEFELQESASADFAGAETIAVSGAFSTTIGARGALVEAMRMHYRVRAVCEGEPGPYSAAVSTIVVPPPAQTGEIQLHAPAGMEGTFIHDFLVPGFGEEASNADTFRMTADAGWLSVGSSSQRALSAGGTTVRITIDPSLLPDGTTTGALHLERTGVSGTVSVNVPAAVSLAGPVTPVARDTEPPPGTRIIPGVAHADGFNSRFESDVRITNASPEPITYDLMFTPTESNGVLTGMKTTVAVAANRTAALDDVVLAFFGLGVLGRGGFGTLEIRPRSGDPDATIASSRTFNVSDTGTFGQFIPALAPESFIGPSAADPLAKISLQQVASSATYRTNLGLVEGSGAGAQVIVRLFDGDGALLASVPFALGPYEHRQIGFRDARLFPDVTLDDGRLEVEVTGGAGTASAYASVLDNRTADPLLVSPVQAGRLAESRYVLPGIAELNTARNFHSDMRIFNPGASPVTVTLSYRPQTGDPTAAPAPVSLTVDPGAIHAVDNVLPTVWGLDGTGGAVTLTTPDATPLVVTARTYSRNSEGGTFGQFIPAVSAAEAVGAGERALQVLQLEQSANFRSNLGLFEVTGNAAKVELVGWSADGATDPFTTTLEGGEFRQMGGILSQLGLPLEWNGRVSVRVIEGAGRVSAYGSVIDFRTEDPTYIPAQ